MKEYKYYLYDWDGCLAKTLDLWLESCKQVLAEIDKYPDDREISKLFGDWSALEKLGHPNIEEANKKLVGHVGEKLSLVELYPNARETLETLHSNGKKIAILTSSPRESLENSEAYQSISQYNSFLIAGEDVENHKPHPEIIEKALQKFGSTPEEAIMVGDSEKDLGAAANADVDSVLYHPLGHDKFYDKEKLLELNPTYIIEDHKGILNLKQVLTSSSR